MKVHTWNYLILLSLLHTGLGQLQFSDERASNNSGSLTFPVSNTSSNRISPRQYAQITTDSFGFEGSKQPDQNLLLHSRGAKQNIQVIRFQRQNPIDFYTTIAIPAQVAGQIPRRPISQNLQRQEYIPYSSNDNPFNYPAYNGFSQENRAPQPLVLAPYEIPNGGNNYRIQSAATPYPYASKGGHINDPYSFNLPNSHAFQAFDPNFFLHGFLPVLNTNRDREPLENNDDTDLSERRQHLQRPIKRSN